MPVIDPDAAQKFQAELSSGESILWASRPNRSVIFHSDDWSLIPFGLFFGGFSIFWEAGVLGFWGTGNRHTEVSNFMVLCGIPFIVMGQYLIWGRFLYDTWLKRRTYYAVTNRRILVVQEGWNRKTSSTYLDAIPTVTREGAPIGTLWFGPKYPVLGSRNQKLRGIHHFSIGDTPVFADIDNVDSVYRLITDLVEKTKPERT